MNIMKKEGGNDKEVVMEFIIVPNITVTLAELFDMFFKICIIIASL